MSDNIQELQREIDALSAEMTTCASRIIELRDQEDPQAGIFHHEEIFSLQQKKLRLQVDIEFRQKKMNRLAMEV